jgi:hypothetical protein
MATKERIQGFAVALTFAGVLVGGSGWPEAALDWGGATPRERDERTKVTVVRTPNGGLQPQAVMDSDGVLHLIYFSGEPDGGDCFYVRRKTGEDTFSNPLRINSHPGSVIALGNIRGAHLAVGKGGRVHVAWMGSKTSQPKGPAGASPMLYTRLNDLKTAFEPQRNIMQFAVGLDGGGSVAADLEGNVFVAWHGRGSKAGEAHRRVWLARSSDEGRTFGRETAANSEPTGACGCCGMRAFADSQGALYLLYRAAANFVNRDIYLLTSNNKGNSYSSVRLDQWKLDVCPMSSAVMAEGSAKVIGAWETAGQVYYTTVNTTSGETANKVSAPGLGKGRKHPAVAVSTEGDIVLVWTEGMGWKRGGSLAWQLFDRDGKPIGEQGTAEGVPVWSLPTVVASPASGFTIIY